MKAAQKVLTRVVAPALFLISAAGCVGVMAAGGAGGVERGAVPDAPRLPRPPAPERRGRHAPVRAIPPRRRH